MKRIYKTEIGASGVSLQFKHKNIPIWFDFYINGDGEVEGDWNAYMFSLHDSKDLTQRKFQNDSKNYEACLFVGLAHIKLKKLLCSPT